MDVDVIFAPSSTFVEAARQATTTIPIVFAVHADPVGLGHVAGLARPGGNVTGTSMLLTELAAKGLEMMAEALPQTRRIGVLWNPTTPSHSRALPAVETAGEKLALELRMVAGARPRGLRQRVCDDGAGARRRFSRRGVTSGCWPARAARRARAQAPPAGHVPIQGERCGGWPHELRRRSQLISIAVPPPTSTRSSRAPSPPTCRLSRPPSTSWSSISKPRRRLASTCRPRCSPAPTR